jgi:hypothetical protein
MTPLERARLVARVVKRYPHLAELAPPHLLAEAEEPEPDDQAVRSSRGRPHEVDQAPGTPGLTTGPRSRP